MRILDFLSWYAGSRTESTAHIGELLEHGLSTTGGRNLFTDHFDPLTESRMTPEEIFEQTLRLTFNASGTHTLRVERLKGTSGELTLSLGDSELFGVINVGDAGPLAKACEDAGLEVTESEFKDSVFDQANDRNSTINLVVGARKFNEGWNSWRVSSMGLMNVGRSEGAQIIQMFGRGVRLKGRGMSLKRSSARPGTARVAPEALPFLETLQVFGVKANYMTQFRDFLEQEGVAADREEFFLPIRRTELPADPPLGRLGLREEVAGNEPEAAFRRYGPMPVLLPPSHAPCRIRKRLTRSVRLDWNPKVRALASDERAAEVVVKNESTLTAAHLDHLDIDNLYFDLVRFKEERGWHNLTVSRTAVRQLLVDPSWYRIQAPQALFRIDESGKIRHWQEIAAALLRKYAARYYGLCREAWESRHLEIRPLDDDDPILQVRGRGGEKEGFLIELAAPSGETRIDALKRSLTGLKAAIDSGDLPNWDQHQVKALRIDQHLYWPLLSIENDKLAVSPPALNKGEFQFVRDLQRFLKQEASRLAGVRIHLMRNQSRGRGIGFFEANNFHPDFILWALQNGRQHIAFIDPKGLVHLAGPDDPKARLHETIKDIEDQLQDGKARLESFLVSVTRYDDLDERWHVDGSKLTQAELADRHILFQQDNAYIGELFTRLGVL